MAEGVCVWHADTVGATEGNEIEPESDTGVCGVLSTAGEAVLASAVLLGVSFEQAAGSVMRNKVNKSRKRERTEAFITASFLTMISLMRWMVRYRCRFHCIMS